jgi:flagellar secretion chaperone FliS
LPAKDGKYDLHYIFKENIMGYEKMLNQYRKTKIETAGKLDLIIICYDRAIQLLTQAQEDLMEHKMVEKSFKIHNTIEIIVELRACLNMEKGGEIAKNLDALYAYIMKRLLNANITDDISAFAEGAKILSGLREAWVTINNGDNQAEDIHVTPERIGSNISRFEAYSV